ncbi:MAG: hypothetical protein AAFP76_14345 [Bacteroidota bacterium]
MKDVKVVLILFLYVVLVHRLTIPSSMHEAVQTQPPSSELDRFGLQDQVRYFRLYQEVSNKEETIWFLGENRIGLRGDGKTYLEFYAFNWIVIDSL